MSRIFVPCIFPRNSSRFPIACVAQSDENSGMNTEHLAKELRLIADRLVDLASRLSSEDPSSMPRKTASNICTRCGKPIPDGQHPVRREVALPVDNLRHICKSDVNSDVVRPVQSVSQQSKNEKNLGETRVFMGKKRR